MTLTTAIHEIDLDLIATAQMFLNECKLLKTERAMIIFLVKDYKRAYFLNRGIDLRRSQHWARIARIRRVNLRRYIDKLVEQWKECAGK